MSFLASPVSDAQHERERSLSKRNRNGKIRRCQECQGQQKFTSFKFTPMWELEINLRQSMWVHSLLYLPATQAVFPGVEPMEWGWRWGKDEAVLLGSREHSTAGSLEENGCWKGNLCSRVSVWWFVWSRTKGQTATKPPNLCCSFLLWLVRGAFKTGPTSHFLPITNHLLNNNFLSVTTEIHTGICISSQSCHFSLLIIYLLL